MDAHSAYDWLLVVAERACNQGCMPYLLKMPIQNYMHQFYWQWYPYWLVIIHAGMILEPKFLTDKLIGSMAIRSKLLDEFWLRQLDYLSPLDSEASNLKGWQRELLLILSIGINKSPSRKFFITSTSSKFCVFDDNKNKLNKWSFNVDPNKIYVNLVSHKNVHIWSPGKLKLLSEWPSRVKENFCSKKCA